MTDYKQQSKRWLDQSKYDLSQAILSLKNKSYAYSCFFAEQSAQKSLKAFLIYHKQLHINIHSVAALLSKASTFQKLFYDLIDKGKKIDKYYLTTRYPDALPEGLIPFEAYNKNEAKEAIKIAKDIFNFSAKELK